MYLGTMRRLTMAVALCLSSLVGFTQASPGLAHQSSINTASAVTTIKFEGRQINLTKGWGEARACVIWEQAGASQCFRTEAEMAHYVAKVEHGFAAGAPASPQAAQCSSWLYLYSHPNYNAGLNWNEKVLQFRDRGVWQNLTAYNFNDNLSSYKVGACGVHLAEHIGGRGYWYPGNTNPGAQEPRMAAGTTNWDNRVSSIYIR